MQIRLFSDIHLDFDVREASRAKNYARITSADLWQPVPMESDSETVLVLAGDLWIDNRPFEPLNGSTPWIELVARRFKAVVCVLGNHDYWEGSLQRAPEKAFDAIDKLESKNIYLLEQGHVVIGDTKFVGGTLWTDYNRGNPMTMLAARNSMNDYARISFGRGSPRRESRPEDMYEVHVKTREHITEHAVKDYPEQKLVVVTHMAPSYESIHNFYRSMSQAEMNFCYYSDLENLILHLQPDFWFHGHVHSCFHYCIGTTEVICNPRGYHGHEETGHDERLLIDTATRTVERTPRALNSSN